MLSPKGTFQVAPRLSPCPGRALSISVSEFSSKAYKGGKRREYFKRNVPLQIVYSPLFFCVIIIIIINLLFLVQSSSVDVFEQVNWLLGKGARYACSPTPMGFRQTITGGWGVMLTFPQLISYRAGWEVVIDYRNYFSFVRGR